MAKENLESLIKEFANIFTTNFAPDKILGTLRDVDEYATKVQNSFAGSKAYSMAIKDNLAGAVSQVRALGGDMDKVAEVQKDVAVALGRNFIATKESVVELYATMKVTGVETSKMVSSFKDAGISSLQAAGEMQKVVDTSTKLGVNVGKTATMVTDQMNLLNKYNFQGGVDGLAKMAAQAVSMRIDIKEMSGLMEKAYDPEKAIEMAAALQRLGVTQSDLLDPLRLLDLSQNDPTELQNQVAEMTKSFVRMGEAGHFEIAPGGKRQLQEIAKEMGLNYETLTKMALSSYELGDKMKKIHFPPTIASEENKNLIANLAELKGGEYKVSVFSKEEGKVVEKAITELSEDDVAELKKMGETKTMEELAKDQLSYLESMDASLRSMKDRTGLGLAQSRIGEEALKTAADYAKILEKAAAVEGLSAEAFRDLINKNTDVVSKMKDLYMKGEISKEDMMKGLHSIVQNTKDTFTTGGEQFKSEATRLFKSTIGGDSSQTQAIDEFSNTIKNISQPNTQAIPPSNPQDVNVNVNFDGRNMPSNINTDQLVNSIKNDMTLRQAIVEAVQSTMSNNNLTPKGSVSPQGSMFSGYMNK